MNVRGCARREEVQAMLARGHWPEGCAAELREHIKACAECGPMTVMMAAMLGAKAHAAPRLPSAELVWWRAQLRKCQAAMEQVRRPLRGAQIFVVVLSLSVAAGVVVWQWIDGGGWDSLAAMHGVLLLLAGAAVVLVAGVVVYVTAALE